MRQSPLYVQIVANFTVSLALATMTTMSPGYARADEQSSTAACTCPEQKKSNGKLRPKLADLTPIPQPAFDLNDQIAALEIVQYALSEVSDKSSYVWHHRHGKLSGIVHPTSSFRDDTGRACRHIVVIYASGAYSRKTETIACRQDNGIWKLDG